MILNNDNRLLKYIILAIPYFFLGMASVFALGILFIGLVIDSDDFIYSDKPTVLTLLSITTLILGGIFYWLKKAIHRKFKEWIFYESHQGYIHECIKSRNVFLINDLNENKNASLSQLWAFALALLALHLFCLRIMYKFGAVIYERHFIELVGFGLVSLFLIPISHYLKMANSLLILDS